VLLDLTVLCSVLYLVGFVLLDLKVSVLCFVFSRVRAARS
jgi:hypothetical protein